LHIYATGNYFNRSNSSRPANLPKTVKEVCGGRRNDFVVLRLSVCASKSIHTGGGSDSSIFNCPDFRQLQFLNPTPAASYALKTLLLKLISAISRRYGKFSNYALNLPPHEPLRFALLMWQAATIGNGARRETCYPRFRDSLPSGFHACGGKPGAGHSNCRD
jgi:hypothetical protein